MKKILIAVFFLGLVCSLAIAASPTVEEGNRVIFKVADQETDSS